MYIIFFFQLILQIYGDVQEIRWCLVGEAEMAKCNKMQIATAISSIASNFKLTCVFTRDVFDCMDKIKNHEADLINLDVGLSYYAVLNYGMRAIAVENYNTETDPIDMKLHYNANVVVIKNSVTNPRQLMDISGCFAGAGNAEGWIYPISRMISENWMSITKCNNIAQVLSAFFTNGSCIPGNKNIIFNPLGDNGELPCKLCSSYNNYRSYCSYSDGFSGSAGAMKCLDKARTEGRVAAAFIRGDVINNMIANGDIDSDKFELLCPKPIYNETYNAPLHDIDQCNWGTPQSRMLLTRVSEINTLKYQRFIETIISHFGINGTNVDTFKLFQSFTDYELNHDLQMALGEFGEMTLNQPLYDLMFSDMTQSIYFPPNFKIINYFEFIEDEFKKAVETLEQCPKPGVTWCVIDGDALDKCGRMRLALETIRVKPPLYCILGDSTTNCMELISEGYADLMSLDAAELYIGGKYLDLVPIAIEFYSDSTDYYGVAVVRRTDKTILISNWKNINTCHGGAGTATGWVLPVTIALNTKQLVIIDKDLIAAFSQLVSRACIPGILDNAFNPKFRNPINLCEICSGGGADLCLANSVEAQYTDSGAFVCLLEVGDLAFVKHFTVYDNTDGRNTVDWARNKRLDDYEILCPDGRRMDTTRWKECNIGKVPGNTIVTAGFKSLEQREVMLSLLRHTQEHFSSDGNPIFSMFESIFNRYDLLFSDSATSLKPIPWINQSYQKILDPPFLRKCELLENLSKPGHSGFYYKPNP